ncbi:MAG: DEAD/DEAH box helicase, partial [Coriobacteriaceae bacterium]|nr:DEAD/DEAH box helicase [Coriobacteriaceae bacterium]
MAKRRSTSTTVTTSTIATEKGLPTRFENLGLSERALAAVRDMGYDTPTPVQAASVPAVLAGTDVMAAAQTGTGKTAAFLLPTLDRLGHARHGQGPLMLVVTPTRELAAQIEEVATAICAHTGHTATVLVGGVSYDPQRAALRRGCDLVVATPGRLIDLINTGDCNLSQVETLVLDEADRMLDMGFLPDMRRIVAKTPASRQTLLFSATLSNDVLDNTKSLVNDPVRIEIAHKGTAAETIDQYVLPISHETKNDALIEILRREGARRVIVFVRGKHRADAICRRL